jgi:hypothetical protein
MVTADKILPVIILMMILTNKQAKNHKNKNTCGDGHEWWGGVGIC